MQGVYDDGSTIGCLWGPKEGRPEVAQRKTKSKVDTMSPGPSTVLYWGIGATLI